jgi:hypothetical protein
MGRVFELIANIFLDDSWISSRQHSGIFHHASPSVRFCLLGPATASDGGRRKLSAARELIAPTQEVGIENLIEIVQNCIVSTDG